jgi:hypothetical protein
MPWPLSKYIANFDEGPFTRYSACSVHRPSREKLPQPPPLRFFVGVAGTEREPALDLPDIHLMGDRRPEYLHLQRTAAPGCRSTKPAFFSALSARTHAP